MNYIEYTVYVYITHTLQFTKNLPVTHILVSIHQLRVLALKRHTSNNSPGQTKPFPSFCKKYRILLGGNRHLHVFQNMYEYVY